MLYDAQLAGTLTSADMEELRHKMRLSAAADGAFEKSVALVHALREEEHNAEVAIEVSAMQVAVGWVSCCSCLVCSDAAAETNVDATCA